MAIGAAAEATPLASDRDMVTGVSVTEADCRAQIGDQQSKRLPSVRNTGWVSVGATGYSHAPILQVVVAQQAAPQVELISIAATFDKLGVNV